jgi:hypothetical protein
MEDNPMRGITQKLSPRRHRLQDPALAFDAQVGCDVRFLTNVAYQRLRLMDVEIVNDKVPTGGRQVGFNRAPNVIDKVFLGPCVAIGRLFNAAGSHVKVDDETLGAMTRVLEFLAFDLAWRHRQLQVLAFQSLYAGHFVRAEHSFILLNQFWSLAIQGVDILYFLVKLLIENLCQPVPNQMRLEIGLFLKASPRAAVRCDLRCRA